MKTRTGVLAVVVAALAALAASGCARVQAKAKFKDGNKGYREENFRRALIDYGRAVELDPNYSEAWFYLGSSHQALYRPQKDDAENREHLKQAIECYLKSLAANPAKTENHKIVRQNALAALTGIYSEEPYKSYDEAAKYAQLLVADNPNDPKNLYALANLYEKFGKIPEAEELYKKVAESNAKDAKACGALAGFYNKPNWDETGAPWVEGTDKPRRSKFDLAIAVLERCAAIDPSDCSQYQKVASFYWDKAYRDPLLADDQKNAYADKGLEYVDKALQCKPDYFEAIIYKGLLYRVKAAVAPNPRDKAQFMEQAQTLQKQGLDLKKQQADEAAQAAATASPAAGQ